MSHSLALGVDIGGTKIAFVALDAQGTVHAQHQTPALPAEGAVALLDRIAAGCQHLLGQVTQPVAGIGIGCPGHVDPVSGIVRTAVNLGWVEVALRAEIERRIPGLPIWLHKDANAAALGELYYGAAHDCDNFVYLAIGTGLGAGAVANGQLITGDNAFANELGHVSLDPDGRLCACGQRGCIEMYISGIGLRAGLREHRADFPDSHLTDAESDTTDLLAAARAGDPLALAVIDEAGRWLGAVMAISAAVLNPALFVIGGGLGHAAADLLFARAEHELTRRVLPPTRDRLRIVRSQVTNSAVGAASLVWHGLSRGG